MGKIVMSTSSPVRMTSLHGAVSTTTGLIRHLRSLDHLHPGLGFLAAHCPSVLILVRVRIGKEGEVATGDLLDENRRRRMILHYPGKFVDRLLRGDAGDHACGLHAETKSDSDCCGMVAPVLCRATVQRPRQANTGKGRVGPR